MTRRSSSALIPIFLLGLTWAAEDPPVPKEFETRIDDYMKLRKQLAGKQPALKDKAEPEQIKAHQDALSKGIREARKSAKQGDILTPEVQKYIREIVRSEMKGAQGKPAKDTAKTGNPRTDGEPNTPVDVRVNSVYPSDAPASSVPPTLLMRLPKLPKPLDFRFVGRHLVLRDADAALIIDFIPNVMP